MKAPRNAIYGNRQDLINLVTYANYLPDSYYYKNYYYQIGEEKWALMLTRPEFKAAQDWVQFSAIFFPVEQE